MVCVYCSAKTQIINSRHSRRLNQTWRRHQCKSCLAIFTTREIADHNLSFRVETRSGHLEKLSRDQLFLDVFSSISHRKTAQSDASALTDTILATIVNQTKSGIISSAEITQITLKTLGRFDGVAEVYYRAHHANSR